MTERKYLLTKAPLAKAPIPPATVFAVLQNSIIRLGPNGYNDENLKKLIPPHPSIALALKDSALHPFSAATMIVDGSVSAMQADLAARHYRETGIPVQFTRLPATYRSFISASSVEYDAGTSNVLVSILLEASCAGADAISATVNGKQAFATVGKNLDKSRRISFAVPADTPETVVKLKVDFPEPRGYEESSLRFITTATDQIKTLLVSRRQNVRSVIESLYPVKRIALENLANENIYLYELIVLDGIRLAELPHGVSERLADFARRGSGSLFFAADSPDFAKPGDAAVIEEILPVDLYPRSLQNLPDMALLLVIDTSGSMFGDKLSLAKVTGVETLSNMKPDDLVGILLFSENFSWLRGFAVKGGLEIARDLDPVRAGGGTRLFDAMREGIEKINNTSMPMRHIVLISDGITEPANFEWLIAEAANSGITVSVMAMGENYNRELLAGIAAGTRGNFYNVRTAQEIPSLLVQDRKNISRGLFSTEEEKIVSMFGTDSGSVTGMSRFTARENAAVLFSTPSGDPLLASREINSRSVFVFSSDIYAGYTKNFFADEDAMILLKTALDSQFREQSPSYTVAETREQTTIVVQSDYFVKPSIAVADEVGNIIQDIPMTRIMPSWYSAVAAPEFDAPHTAIISDCGTSLARFSFFSNGTMEAVTDSSKSADDWYKSPFLALVPGKNIWLILFFSFSLGLTILRRIVK